MARTERRRRRVLILTLCSGAVLALAGGAYALRQAQLSREAQEARDVGCAAIAAGEWSKALDGIGRYLQRNGDSGATCEDYVLYARARRNVEMPNGRHITGAIASLRRALEIDPTNAEARSDLLELYVLAGYTTECLDLVNEMLSGSPGDVRLLRVRRDALASIRRTAEALEVSKEIARLAPDDVAERFRALELYLISGAPVHEVDAWVDGEITSHVGDARFELLRAALLTRRQDKAGAKEVLDHVVVASAATADPKFAVLLVRELDAAGRYDDSLRVLERADSKTDPEIGHELVRRLWYAHRYDDLCARIDSMLSASARAGEADRDPEMTALHLLALRATGKADAAAPLQESLDGRTDPVGRAWRRFVRSTSPAPGTTVSVGGLNDAVKAVPQSACIRSALGDAYASLGETDLALEAWSAAVQRAPSWPTPLCRIAETLLVTGREHLAPAVARAAVEIAPSDPAVVATYLRAAAAVAGDLDRRGLDSYVRAADALNKLSPADADATMPEYVAVLARIDPRAAEERLQSVLGSAKPPSETTLLRLARIARTRRFPVEMQLLEMCEKAYGATPQLSLARALGVARASGAEAGVAEFDALRARARSGTDPFEWELVHASCLDELHQPTAGRTWIALANAHPDSLPSQLGALASASAWQDRDAVSQVIDRVRLLTGDEAVTWRIARARWLIWSDSASQSQVAQAAQMLSEVSRVAPRSTVARLLLAQAFEKLGNLPGAEQQLRLALELAPDEAGIALELAAMAQRQGRPDEAKRRLDRILQNRDLEPQNVERAAYLLAVQGDQRRSASLLEPLEARSQTGRDGALLLARLYGRLGETKKALEICSGLLSGTPDAEVVEVAAAIRAGSGDLAGAESVLAKLDTLHLPDGDRELIRARHAATWSGAAAAGEWYRKAADAAPDRAVVWNEWLAHAVGSGDAAAVKTILDDRRAAQAPAVRFAQEIRPICESAVGDACLRTLLMAAIDAPDQRPVLTKCLRTVVEGWPDADRRADVAREVRELAKSNVRLLPLQLVAAQLCCEVGDMDRASEIAHRAEAEFVNSAAAARQAAETFARFSHWPEALESGRAWQERASRDDARPAVFVAEALGRTGRAAEALPLLEPRVQPALARPEQDEALLSTYAVTLVRCGRAGDASKLLADLAKRSARWKTSPLAVDPVRFPDAAAATAWLRTCNDIVPAEDPRARLLLARAWAMAWERFRAPELLAGAKSSLAALASTPVAAEARYVEGTLAEQSGDNDGAKRAYEEAIHLDANLVGARNNLAWLLADAGRWQEALDHATEASRAAPRSAACLDTLAYALRKGGRFDEAEKALAQAIRLEPCDPKWQLSRGEVLAETGRSDEIRGVLARVDELVGHGAEMSSASKKRLDRLRAAAH